MQFNQAAQRREQMDEPNVTEHKSNMIIDSGDYTILESIKEGEAREGKDTETTSEYSLILRPTEERSNTALEVAILGWLDAKRGRSGSQRTWRTYADTLSSFRSALAREGLDLDGPSTAVALVAQAWAGTITKPRKDKTAGNYVPPIRKPNTATISAISTPITSNTKSPKRGPAATTYNQRLASVSSFYKYARKQSILQDNPIERVERRSVQAYAGSRALDAEYVKRSLALIDRTTPIGARDYALLLTYLQTGRRLSEVAALECRDLEQVPGGKLRVTFRRCKGGKILYDTLTPQVSAALLAYLSGVHDAPFSNLDGSIPVWVSLAERNGTLGGQLSKVSISRICKARLGTTRVHTLRSTMAQVMEKKGAPVSLIQQRLAHNSLATTGIYLASLRQDDNPYADEIAGAFGAD